MFKIVAEQGDNNLGGVNVDEALFEHCRKIWDDEGNETMTPTQKAKVMRECRRVKEAHADSTNDEASHSINLEALAPGADLDVDFSFALFKQLIQPIVNKCKECVHRAL